MPRYITVMHTAGGDIPLPSSYVGPGDVVSGATMWVGLRAYSRATAGSLAVNLRRDSDNSTQDFSTLTSGQLDVASIATFKGAANLFVTKLYDQTGNGNDFSQATAATQPGLTLAGLGSLPIMTFSGAAPQYLTEVSHGQVTPWTLSVIVDRTANFTTQQNAVQSTSGAAIYFPASADHIAFFLCGVGQTLSAPDNNYYAAIATNLPSGSTENAYVNGTTGTAGAASNTAFTAPINFGASNVGTVGLFGNGLEVGVWPIEFNVGQAGSMISNQRAYWGF